jgi:metal transporter CNNM
MTCAHDIASPAAVAHRYQTSCRLLSGYSRFPVHTPGDPYNFVGLLLIKKVRVCSISARHWSPTIVLHQLIAYDPELRFAVSNIPLSILPEAKPSINCFQVGPRFLACCDPLLLIRCVLCASLQGLGLLVRASGLKAGFRLIIPCTMWSFSQTGRAHLLLISDHPGEPHGALGVVTLEGNVILTLRR